MSDTDLSIDEIENEQNMPNWNTTDVILISLAILLFFFLAAFGLNFTADSNNVSDFTVWTSTLLASLEGIVLIGSVYIVGLRRRGWNWEHVGLIKPSSYWLSVSIVIGIFAIPVSAIIAVGIQLALGRPIENTQLTFLAPNGFTWFSAISMFILGGLIAPVAEELYFRGVLFHWLNSKWTIWPSILLSALVFGLVHGEASVAGAAFVLGIFMAWVYYKSSSLWTAIIVHAINNSVKILLLYVFLGLSI